MPEFEVRVVSFEGQRLLAAEGVILGLDPRPGLPQEVLVLHFQVKLSLAHIVTVLPDIYYLVDQVVLIGFDPISLCEEKLVQRNVPNRLYLKGT